MSEACPKCPECGEGLRIYNAPHEEWFCGSTRYPKGCGEFKQSATCMERVVADKDARIAALAAEVERLTAENNQLRKGAPLGPIIGAQTILEKELELKRLRKIVKLPQPDVAYKAIMARSEQLKQEPSQ